MKNSSNQAATSGPNPCNKELARHNIGTGIHWTVSIQKHCNKKQLNQAVQSLYHDIPCLMTPLNIFTYPEIIPPMQSYQLSCIYKHTTPGKWLNFSTSPVLDKLEKYFMYKMLQLKFPHDCCRFPSA